MGGLGGVLGGCVTAPDEKRDAVIGSVLRLGALASVGAPASDPHGELDSPFDRYRMAAIYDVLAVPGTGGKVVPRLAVSWEVDRSATRWRFDLRNEAVFADGKPVLAADVLYSVRRTKRLTATGGHRLGPVDADRSYVENDHTVVLVTASPDPELPRTMSGVFVVPADTEDFGEPLGSGPFRQAVLRGRETWLLASGTWWGPPPGVDQITLLGFPDARGLENAVTSGTVDAAFDVEPAAAVIAGREQGLAVVRSLDARAFGVLMRADRPPFDRPQVREAIKLALDRQALVDVALVGMGRPGNDVPTPSDPSFPADLAPPARDRGRARELLSAAGFPDGFPVVLHTTTTRAAMAGSANVIAGQLAEVGLRVQVAEHSPETYWSTVYDSESFVVTCHEDVQFPEWAGSAVAGWPDPGFTEQLASALTLADEQARRAAFTNLQRDVAARGAEAVWGFADACDVAWPEVRDLPAGSGLARTMLDAVWLAR
jgi:peptide/nickel transport system substrate-binding protein